MATNNAINGPIPWKWNTVVSGPPPANEFPLTAFNGYITSETVLLNIPLFAAFNTPARIRVGDQYRIMSKGAGCIGFHLNRRGAQRLWYNGAQGITATPSPGFEDGTSITVTCVDAFILDGEQFLIELGTGAITLT